MIATALIATAGIFAFSTRIYDNCAEELIILRTIVCLINGQTIREVIIIESPKGLARINHQEYS